MAGKDQQRQPVLSEQDVSFSPARSVVIPFRRVDSGDIAALRA